MVPGPVLLTDSMSFALFLSFLFCREIETLSVIVFPGMVLPCMSNILESETLTKLAEFVLLISFLFY